MILIHHPQLANYDCNDQLFHQRIVCHKHKDVCIKVHYTSTYSSYKLFYMNISQARCSGKICQVLCSIQEHSYHHQIYASTMNMGQASWLQQTDRKDTYMWACKIALLHCWSRASAVIGIFLMSLFFLVYKFRRHPFTPLRLDVLYYIRTTNRSMTFI